MTRKHRGSHFQKGVADAGLPIEQRRVIHGNPFNQATANKTAVIDLRADLTRDYVVRDANTAYYQFLKTLPNSFDDLTQEFGLEVYYKMLFDAEVGASVGMLSLATLANGWRVKPVQSENVDPNLCQFCADFVKDVLDGMETPFLSAVEQILDGLWLGSSVSEMKWSVYNGGRYDGLYRVADLKNKPLKSTSFVVDSFYNVISLVTRIAPGMSLPIGSIIPISFEHINSIKGMLPRANFMVFTWNPPNGDPRGRSILRPAYSAWWMKQQVMNEWLAWIAQFSRPILVAETAPNAQPIPIKDNMGNIMLDSNGNPICRSPASVMVEDLEKARSGSVVVLPNGADARLLQVSGEGAGLKSAIEFADRQITRAITHQHLASGEAQHQSRASSQVHQDILGMLIIYIKQMLSSIVKRELIRPLIMLNFGAGAEAAIPAIDFGFGDGFPIGPDSVARLYQTGYLTSEQLPALDEMLGLPVRKKISSMLDRAEKETAADDTESAQALVAAFKNAKEQYQTWLDKADPDEGE